MQRTPLLRLTFIVYLPSWNQDHNGVSHRLGVRIRLQNSQARLFDKPLKLVGRAFLRS